MTQVNSDDIIYQAPSTMGSVCIASGFSLSMGSPSAVSIPKDQLIFWTRKWRDGEAESAAARAAGRTHEFSSATDAVRWLFSED